ncbi:HD domain-containing protein [Streptomyces sp. NBC_00377]|uniref:HD domain-containing protein n=1 Tax=unclassified Streptomyces TaxID=2593676 RepID=UPI002E1A4C01|nr:MULTISPECIES: HD domain-containing protein [unclassified Streptomyces]
MVSLIEELHLRRNGDPVLTHCLTVAAIVAGLRMPPSVVCAALLHDLEDTACPPNRPADRFGTDIAGLVAALPTALLGPTLPAGRVTEPPTPHTGPSQQMAVLTIRLADRLHNLRTSACLSPATRYRIARETLEVFAPVARTAGLHTVGRELDALASAVLHPSPSAHGTSARVLTILNLLLPTRQRARWQEEWNAELAAHATRRARIRFTARVLRSTPRLSMTLHRPTARQRRW